ncbi:MAG: TIM-barrel domain-containing protein [Candidatus Zhuqueibacterota bacterium]
MKIAYKILVIFLFSIYFFSERGNAQSGWQEQANGVWRIQFGNEQKIDLIKATHIMPKWTTLKSMPSVEFPLDSVRIKAVLLANKTYLRFPLSRGEQIFGLGLQFKTVNQRGRILNLHMDHFGGQDNGRTHAPVPFYVSSSGYGVFINSAEYLTVYVGTGVRKDANDPPIIYDRNEDDTWEAQPYSDAVEILIPSDGAEVYIFGGPSPLDAVRRFNLFTGGGVLPPKWGLGFTYRMPRLYSADDVRREVSEFEAHDFPLDFVGLEPGWQSRSYPCTFDWDPIRFPNPAEFIRELKDKGIRINLWFNPYLSPESSIFEVMKSYTASHSVWNGWIPDYTISEAREIFQKHLEHNLVGIDVSGFKIDEVDGFDEWLWPDVAIFPSGHTATQMRQIYGLLVQDVVMQVYKNLNVRTYGLVRGTNAGSAGLPFVIYNDYYSHRDFITALCNSSFIGVLWTPEVRASESGDEWLRRMQSVCFSPLAMINAWADNTKPWSFLDVENPVREVCDLRMQLLPYLYTTFAQYYFEGTPPIRAMNLLSTAAVNKTASWKQAIDRGVNDQYMLGDYLMVAPVFADETMRDIIFPEGKWYDFYTGEFAGESEVKQIKTSLERIPVFVKDGGIIPLLEKINHAPRLNEKHLLTIRHYGESNGQYNLYDDDGETYNYEQGQYQWRTIKVYRENGTWKGTITPPKKDKPDSYLKANWIFMTKLN